MTNLLFTVVFTDLQILKIRCINCAHFPKSGDISIILLSLQIADQYALSYYFQAPAPFYINPAILVTYIAAS